MGFPLHILKRNPEKFIAKKVLYFCPLLTIFSFIAGEKWYLYMVGLLIGILGGLTKLYFMGDAYTRLFIYVKSVEKPVGVKWTIIKFIFAQLFSYLVLVVSAVMGFSSLVGALIGILIVPGVISINSVTEFFGLSRNKFGCR
jgi:hypothetical protein